MAKKNRKADNTADTEDTLNESKQITLDGRVVTIEELNEARANTAVRIIEANPGSYRTLTRMRG